MATVSTSQKQQPPSGRPARRGGPNNPALHPDRPQQPSKNEHNAELQRLQKELDKKVKDL